MKNLKEGSKVYCHTTDYHMTNKQIYTKGEYYIIKYISRDHCYISSNDGTGYFFNYDDEFEYYFFTLTEYRKQKLKKLDNETK